MAKTEIELINGKRLNDTAARAAAAKNAEAIEALKNGQGSGGNVDLTPELKTALVNYYTHVMPNFDDTNGLAYINAILTALGAETREEPDEPVVPDEPDEPETPVVTLTSISATYSGGDVAVGTDVTDLTGIVVTAYYSDGTSKAVTGYTLSGTIAEGSNTVTVSYGGKSTTFVVTGMAESGGGVVILGTPSAQDNYAVKFYSDAGETAYNPAKGYMALIASVDTFEEDTKVKITLTSTTQVFDLQHIASAILTDNTDPTTSTAYYTIACGSSSWANFGATHEVEYTVKAGHQLLITAFSGFANNGGTGEVTATVEVL